MTRIKLDHVGIAVQDISRAKAAYEALGLRCSGEEEVPSEQVRVAMFPVGEGRLELLQSTDPEGVIARFINRRGEGIHHICLAVEDLDGTLAGLRNRGLRLVDEKPRAGVGASRVAFIHPSSTAGVLIELREEASHLRPKGNRRPVRPTSR